MRASLKIGLTLAAGVTIAATAAGVTYAATSTSSKVVYACANKSGTLRLLAKGKCPHGYGKVAINKQGPRGLTGARGPQGPGAFNVLVTSNGTSTPVTQRRIAALGITVTAFCGDGPLAELDIDADPNKVGYSVAGQSQFGGGTAVILHLPPGGGSSNHDPVDTGASLVSLDEPAAGNSTEFINRGGDWYANLVVTRGSHAFALQLHSINAANRCLVRAVVTPAG